MSGLGREMTIGVVGAGTMGAGIAQIAADSGHSVKLYDSNRQAVDQGINHLKTGLQKLVDRGRKPQKEVDQLISRIEPCDSLSALSDSGLVIEAVVEDLSIKQKLFSQLEEICTENTIIASNTSSISITEIAAGLRRPQNLVGMHFFNPAPVMKLVEVVSGVSTAIDVARTVFDTARNWGKKPVYAKSSPGFIVNRVARAYYAEPLRLLQEAVANIATIDALFKQSAGFRMGPFELMDLIGNDINFAVTESVYHAFYQDSRFQPSFLQKEMVAGGFLGRKSGRGWYDYAEGSDNPKVEITSSDLRPEKLTVCGDPGIASELVSRAGFAGIEVIRKSTEHGFLIGETRLALTDGRTATRRSHELGESNLVLFDLVANFADCAHIAIAKSQLASDLALQQAIGFLNTLGFSVSVIDDTPGLCLMRTVCMLVNEGADTVYQGVCDAKAVDTAMIYGVNYPLGPLQWADQIGLDLIQSVLRNLHQAYQLDRYRCSLLINRMVEAGENFHG